MRGRSILLAGSAAIALCGLAACAPAFVTRTAGVTVAPGRLAVGPAVVSVVEFDGSGKLAPRPDWAADAAQNVDAAVAARVTANGGRTFVAADVAHTDVAYGDFRRWSSGALQEIAGKIDGSRASAHRSVADWRYPQSLATWHAALAADFVLAVLFVDAYEPAGQAAPAAAGRRSPRLRAIAPPRPASRARSTSATGASSGARPRARGSAICGRPTLPAAP